MKQEVLKNYNNCLMISHRLQQTLNSRVQLIQSLLLIYSYSELVNLRVEQYRKQNEKIHQRELLLLQTYKNIFKMDNHFRKLFHSLTAKIFTKLNSKFKPTLPNLTVTSIAPLYRQFLSFFKTANELEIVRYLQKLSLQLVSENQLFFQLTSTLIQYMKSKTDTIILKLREKCKKEDLDFYEENSIRTIELEQLNHRKKRQPEKKKILTFSRRKIYSPSASTRKYHSEENRKPTVSSERKYSHAAKAPTFETECRQFSNKAISKINWKVGLKKFKEVFWKQWNLYYTLIAPISEHLQELKQKQISIQLQQKRQWIYEHFHSIYKEALARNQPLMNTKNTCQKNSKTVLVFSKRTLKITN